MERFLRLVTVVVATLLLLPALTGDDGFPISTHPMYASVRGDTASFITAVGLLDDGSEARLTMQTIAETDDPLIAERRTRTAAANDPDQLCQSIAARVESPVTTVEVRTEIYGLNAAIEVRDTEVLATCEPAP